ncbi:hypothetical protein BKD84_03985 [Corynebacterium diphtheriae]|nr:hypothetical protein BKD84_11520 [Corynebacterium diphtheriae]OFI55080.1 hypothetical protein BKD84_11200 [Corynebacterium diphtheriae]OFI55402.1 hypothetical protein BKD84_10050 [Corynebacterium diphtheriae]OFI55803.1 hypothetical protein BKD84_08765 [Corynebacterium diphtheriae]OFI56242.1 hypothetical protein BKD84_07225 [Corynebacterium diphtheriae]
MASVETIDDLFSNFEGIVLLRWILHKTQPAMKFESTLKHSHRVLANAHSTSRCAVAQSLLKQVNELLPLPLT